MAYIKCSLSEADNNLINFWEKMISKQRLNPSLLPQWLDIVARSHNLLPQLNVLTETYDNKPCGVFPYMIRTRPMNHIPLKWIEPAFNVVSYHPEMICSNKSQNLLSELLQREANHWDIAYIHNISPDGDIAQQIMDFSNTQGHVVLQHQGESSPYILIKGTWDNFLSTKRSKFRNNLKRRIRKIRAAGQIEIRWYEGGDDSDSLMQSILRIEEESWKVGADMSVARRPVEIDYYQNLIPFLSQSGRLFSNVLSLDKTPIAYSLCYREEGKIGQLKTSYSSKHKNLYPGSIINENSVRRAYDTGAQEFDFLGDMMPHKMEWADELREHKSYYIFSRRLPVHLLGKAKKLVSYLRKRRRTKERSEASINA